MIAQPKGYAAFILFPHLKMLPPTHQRRFLDEINRVVPGADLVAAIAFVYPKTDGTGRPLVGIKRMLRLHCLQ